MKKFILLVALLIVAVAPAAAQTASTTLTFTEAQINSAFPVTNPRSRNLSDIHVDLQPDQVVITATYATRGRAPTAYAISTTLVPTVTNGRVNWTVTTASVDGTALSNGLLNQINAHIAATWRRYIGNTAPLGRITAITITDDEVTYTYTPR